MPEPHPSAHEQLLADYVDLWNGDFSNLDVVSESVVLSDPGVPEGEMRGRDEFEAYLRELRTGFPDFRVSLTETLATDELVMAEWTVTGTHEGEFNGIPPTERRMELRGMDKIRIVDGEVREHRIYYNVQELFEQLELSEE